MARKMLEAAAEANEELMNKYLETGDLSEEDIKKDCALERLILKSCLCYVDQPLKIRVCKLCWTQ